MKIIFMGTPEFAGEILKELLVSQHQVIAVVTQPDRPKGRKKILTPPIVKEIALEHDIPVYQPVKIRGSEESYILRDMEADLIITAAYGQFVPTYLLNSVKKYAVNVHASLLPKHRGGAPIHYAIWKGDQETGISIIEMVKEMDAGDIFYQQAIPILSTDDVGDQFNKLAQLGRVSIRKFIEQVEQNKVQRTVQDPDLVTFSPNIPSQAERISWKQSAHEIDCHVRAFRPFPSTYSILEGQRIKIWAGHIYDHGDIKATASPGLIVAVTDTSLIVACGNASYYAITSWQENGKKRIDLSDYFNGQDGENLIGKRFESIEEEGISED